MWSHEVSSGTTVYFDESKNWHASTSAFFEIHTKKRDDDLRVGNILTLEGGAGRSFLKGAGTAGVAYYAQWKVTNDSGSDFSTALSATKNRVSGLGPELTLPFFAKGPWVGLVTFRYYWEVGARAATEGRGLVFFLTLARLKRMMPVYYCKIVRSAV
jgi:hypothetical protein